MINKLVMLLTLLLLLQTGSEGQVIPETGMEDNLERLSERATSETDISDALEDLISLANHPIDINNASHEDLLRIPFLNEKQIVKLSEYRQAYGEVLTLFELSSVAGFDSTLIRKIEPYIVFRPISLIPAPSPGNLFKHGHNDLLLRCEQVLPDSKGYNTDDSLILVNPNAGYQGPPQRYYLRYNYSWFDKIRVGLSGEKDPGEQFFRGAQRWGMDYYAGFISLTNLGILKNLTIGNFRVSFGQGLTFGSGLSTGSMPGFTVSTALAPSFIRSSGAIRPSLSVNEGDYLRGLAGTLRTGPVEITCFASWHRRDANVIQTDTLSAQPSEVSSLTSSGYHRTPSEIADQNAISELVAGGNITTILTKGINFGMKIGVTGAYSHWSAALYPELKTYSRFSFRGTENYVLGADWLLRFKSLFLSGEISRSANGGLAFISMASFAPDPRANFTLIYRNYQPDYQNLFSNAFGQNSNNCNERGLYISANLSVFRKLMLSLFGDFYTFPWLKYRVDWPTQGFETGVLAGWQAARNVNLTFRFYQKSGAINNSSADINLHTLLDSKLRSYRLSLNWSPDPAFILNTRLEVRESSTGDLPAGYGYLFCQDLQMKPARFPVSGTLRYALFDIPGYDQRIYLYEPEVLYGYSMPAYSGKGIRVCLVVKWRICRWWDFWGRCGITCYSDRNEVGTGLDLRSGNTVTELTGQVMFRF